MKVPRRRRPCRCDGSDGDLRGRGGGLGACRFRSFTSSFSTEWVFGVTRKIKGVCHIFERG